MTALTNTAIRLAKAKGKAYTLPDSDGLTLAIAPEGGKSWHFRFYWMGRQKRLSFGTFPAVSLEQARALRDEARELLAQGIHPGEHRNHKREAARREEEQTFEAIFLRWFAHRCLTLKEGRQTARSYIQRIFAKDVLPFIGKRSISEIKRADLLDLLARVEERKAFSVAERIRGYLNQLYRYALVILPDLEYSPATDLDVVAAPQPPVQHNPHLRMNELPKLLQRVRSYRGDFQTQLGLRLLLLTGVRTGELRQATPDQFDTGRGLWIIPSEDVKQLFLKMSRKRLNPSDIPPYIVPLSIQAIEIVKFMLNRFEPEQRYLFRHRKDPQLKISENTLNQALKGMGYQNLLTGHGIRGTLSTGLNEIGYPLNWIDAQLSHADPNKVSAAYNHAEYVEQRRAMMQDWADRLDMLEQGMAEKALAPLSIGHAAMPVSAPEPKVVYPQFGQNRKAATQSAPPDSPAQPTPLFNKPLPADSLCNRLSAVVAPRAPVSEEQRKRMEKIDTFDLPHNLPVATFARMAGKSIRTLNYQIATGHYLALTLGNRGKRIPDWHLDPHKHALIESVLKLTNCTDPWQIYRALSSPDSRLNNLPPIELAKSMERVTLVMAVCERLKESMVSVAAAV
ncbi:MAG: tyrosine-type recombinase/integrase [Betaproteobacteria bacterium]|nr:tyrosine-type recombinase/integrase [Betaproteobacteria bacterium]